MSLKEGALTYSGLLQALGVAGSPTQLSAGLPDAQNNEKSDHKLKS